jgi:cellulose synthase operon protein C
MVAAVGLALVSAHGQTPLNPPVPLAPPPATISPAELSVTREAAERAHDLGQLSAAATLYAKLLAAPEADRVSLTLALVTVLLDAGRAAEAEQALANVPAPRTAAWHLRAGLAAMQLRKRDAAQAEWDATKPGELNQIDQAWYTFLEGALYDTLPARNVTKANELYTVAEKIAQTAQSDLAKARFQLAAERVRLELLQQPSREVLEETRRNYELHQGRDIGYDTAKLYAAMLVQVGRKVDALQFLTQVLVSVPAQNRAWRDEFNFLIGLIGDRGRNGAGRNALNQLLASGSKPERQRQALQLLADESTGEAERVMFRNDLNRLIAATPAHPIKESLLYFRAQLALVTREHSRAEDDANLLLRDFPGSSLRVHAFGVLTQSAWDQGRYRLAADHARKAREALPASGGAANVARARFDLGVLEAEAWFRAGDHAERVDGSVGASQLSYRSAADVYAAVLRERPPNLEPKKLSALLFQRALAEIKAGPAEAAKVLDELALDPAFDLENRWEAEWSLARAQKIQGNNAAAFARVAKLLADTGAATARLDPNLRVRMAWLQAQLAFDAQQYDETHALIERLLAALGDVELRLRQEITSTAVLLKARAEFALGRETAGLETLKALRASHRDSEAAVYSYLIEAEHFRAQGKIVDAQLRLTGLVDTYRNSDYVPYALFQLALLSEQLGREENLIEANQRIEDLIKLVRERNMAGQDNLVFWARLKQGDLFRRRSDFAAAQQAYEELVNKYPHRPDVVLAQLALAETHNAQSSADAVHADIAQLKFEELCDRADAPPDVRVEAGYNLGRLLVRRGKPDEAAGVWWKDVIDPFLKKKSGAFEQEAKRPYWLARTLLELGELLEQQGKFDEAKEAYQLLLRAKLGYSESFARKNLQRLGVPAANL